MGLSTYCMLMRSPGRKVEDPYWYHHLRCCTPPPRAKPSPLDGSQVAHVKWLLPLLRAFEGEWDMHGTTVTVAIEPVIQAFETEALPSIRGGRKAL